MIRLYLTTAAESKHRTLRAIRESRSALAGDTSMKAAFSAYDELIAEGETLLGSGDADAVAAATKVLDTDALVWRIEDDIPQPSGEEPSFRASKCAMILMHAVDGNPTYALSIARALGRATEEALWNEVEDAILESFPPVPTGSR